MSAGATLAIALLVPWVFWGVLMGLLMTTGRSWINMLLMPVITTVVILAAVGLSTVRHAFWGSLIFHFFLFVCFFGSYISFVFSERKKKRNDRQTPSA